MSALRVVTNAHSVIKASTPTTQKTCCVAAMAAPPALNSAQMNDTRLAFFIRAPARQSTATTAKAMAR